VYLNHIDVRDRPRLHVAIKCIRVGLLRMYMYAVRTCKHRLNHVSGDSSEEFRPNMCIKFAKKSALRRKMWSVGGLGPVKANKN